MSPEEAGAEKRFRVAVIGATGLVGREVVTLLAERRFPLERLLLFASERSAGEEIDFLDEAVSVERLPREPPDVDIAFVCATPEVSRGVAEELADAGATVIDLTGAHRASAAVPLVTAGWDGAELRERGGGIVVALPDALGQLLTIVLRPLTGLGTLRRVIVTALLSASSFGQRAVEDLARETVSLLNAKEVEDAAPAGAFSNVPESAGGTLAAETGRDVRRLLGLDVPVHVTVIRTPTFHAQVVSVTVEMAGAISAEHVGAALREAPSVVLAEAEEAGPPPGSRDSVGSDAVHAGGVRIDPADPCWVQFWAAADNLRQGAALTAVSVAEVAARIRRLHS